MNNKRPVSAERTHEKPKLEDYVIPRDRALGAPRHGQVICSQYKRREVKPLNRKDERFQRALRQAENTLAPNLDFANRIQENLNVLGNFVALTRGPDEH